MEHATGFGSWRNLRFWSGTAALLAIIFGTSALTRHGSATESRVLAAACIAAIGTLATAAVNARAVRYPRWAYWTAAVLTALGLIASAIFASTPRVWAEETRSLVWMVPWVFILFALMPASTKGACAPDSPKAGWFLVGTGVVYALILQVPSLLHRS